MVSVEEASRIIFSNLLPCKPVTVPLAESFGRILAEPIAADRAFPPFDRVSMDGIAIAYDAYRKGRKTFPIAGVQAAGQARLTLTDADHCMEVMTGAILPNGTDTVIRYEDLTISEKTANINEVINEGQNVHRTGIDAKVGEPLLLPGIRISPAEIAVLASVGKNEVKIFSFPSAAVISTGDELVEIENAPLPHQIRKSNVYALHTAMREMHWNATLFHYPDDESKLEHSLEQLLKVFDVLILSGGVSKGKLDFIPKVMEKIGVKKLFHQVNQRPGRPFWFGRTDSGKTVFALPGNPVSTFMCFYRYIRPWALKCTGKSVEVQSAILKEDFSFQPSLTYFLQVRASYSNGMLEAYPVIGGGSGDFANLKDVTGFLELPDNVTEFKTGSVYPYIPFRQ